MFNKIKSLIRENRENQQFILAQTRELEWAHVYHDSIRGKPWLEQLPLNIGRWAGNYAFFYILNRILSDCKPQSILDLGLGESTKFISTYLDYYLTGSKHTIVEHDASWAKTFSTNFALNTSSQIIVCPLIQQKVHGFDVNAYTDFDKKINGKFDFIIVDGPFGSPRFSRHDILQLMETYKPKDEFVLLFDDHQRKGEQDTIMELIQLLDSKKIPHYDAIYAGNKSLYLIATNKYRFTATL